MKKLIYIILFVIFFPLHISSQTVEPPDIPNIWVSFLSDPYIINDNVTENSFVMGLFNTNIPGSNADFTLTPEDTLHFWFIIDDQPNNLPVTRPWGLTTNEFYYNSICKMEADPANWTIYRDDKIKDYPQFKGWGLIPQKNITIRPGEHVKFTVIGLKSGLPSGPTYPSFFLRKKIDGVTHISFKQLTPIEKGAGHTHMLKKSILNRSGYKMTLGLMSDKDHNVGFFSKNNVPLMEVEGETGNTYVKGNLMINGNSLLLKGNNTDWEISNKGDGLSISSSKTNAQLTINNNGDISLANGKRPSISKSIVGKYDTKLSTEMVNTGIRDSDYVVSLTGYKLFRYEPLIQRFIMIPDSSLRVRVVKLDGFWQLLFKASASASGSGTLKYEINILANNRAICSEEPEYIMKTGDTLNTGEIIYNTSFYSTISDGYFKIYDYNNKELFKTTFYAYQDKPKLMRLALTKNCKNEENTGCFYFLFQSGGSASTSLSPLKPDISLFYDPVKGLRFSDGINYSQFFGPTP